MDQAGDLPVGHGRPPLLPGFKAASI